MISTSSHTHKAFTLIELMVVMTILSIVSLATYLPYAHHQKKVLVKQGAKEIVQSLTEARNLAINGVNTVSGTGNQNIALYFGVNAEEIIYYTTDFGNTFTIGSLTTNPDIKVYKIKKLPPRIQVDSITGTGEETLISFKAISGELEILSSDSTYTSGEIMDIQVSYGGATSSVLQKQIEYYTQSYISDY